MIQRMKAFDLRPALPGEIAEALVLGEELIKAPLADLSTVRRVQAATGITVWVTGDPLEGLYLIIPLSEAGHESVRNGTFEPENPADADLCHLGDPCHGVYVGIYAGRTKAARRNIMLASATLRCELFGTLPCFARAATEDGARSMISLGFQPLEDSLPDLFVQEPVSQPSGVAA